MFTDLIFCYETFVIETGVGLREIFLICMLQLCAIPLDGGDDDDDDDLRFDAM
jgi:hypothetical protein